MSDDKKKSKKDKKGGEETVTVSIRARPSASAEKASDSTATWWFAR